MKQSTKCRLVGAAILLFNLWAIGQFNIEGWAVLVMTIGFVIAYEVVVVRPVAKDESNPATD